MHTKLFTGFALAMVFSALPSATAAQVPQSSQSGQMTASSACTDKVRVTDFTITSPTPMERRLALTIKNLCTGTATASVLNVPWRITVAGRSAPLGSGLLVIPPGGSAVAVTMWTIMPGSFSFDGEADPGNTLNESTAARANNLPTGIQISFTSADINQAIAQVAAATAAAGEAAISPCTVADKFQLSSFTTNPGAPVADQQVTLKIIIKNNCTHARTFPWGVWRGTTLLRSGTSASIPGGGSATVSHSWRATTGTHSFSAVIDPGSTIDEPPSARTNTHSNITVTVGAGS
ncbi:MAG: hypothetical protein ACT4O1_07935 [Gemmatimonadota bacterium]